MAYTATLPTTVGTYRHRWHDAFGVLREHVLFVGYTNARAPRLQGAEPNAYMPRKLKCCKPGENLHADRLSPAEWGGRWERSSEREVGAPDPRPPSRASESPVAGTSE